MEITLESFKINLQQFLTHSNQIHDDWKLHDKQFSLSDNSIYLVKKLRKRSRTEECMLIFEYHITFEPIFSTPKLCFNIFRTDGSLLQHDEVIQQFDFMPNENVFEILTQVLHPVLQVPFYGLHPCKTADLMNMVAKNSRNSLVTWLSTVGPTVGLNLGTTYAKIT